MNDERGMISDGFHTFHELYTHRHALFLTLLHLYADQAFKTRKNKEGEELFGWFIAGIHTTFGQISYHLPSAYWDMLHIPEVEKNHDYDGHSASDVVDRLLKLSELIAWSGN